MENWKIAEKHFEGSFARYGKGAFVHRMTDTAAAKATSGKHAFIVAQPSDYLVVHGELTYFAEVKSTQEKVSFPHSALRKNQVAKARQITMAGGTYLVFIKAEALNQWFRVPAQVFFHSIKKSTPWADLQEFAWNI